MAKSKELKIQLSQQIVEKLDNSTAGFVGEYSGVKADELALFRAELRKSSCEFTVVKNRAVKKSIEAASKSELAEMSSLLTGPIGIAFAKGDIAASAKELLAFAKTNSNFKVTGGVMDGKKLSEAEIKALSELPSKETMLGQIVGLLVSPHRGLMYSIKGVSGNLVRAIGAIKDKKQA